MAYFAIREYYELHWYFGALILQKKKLPFSKKHFKTVKLDKQRKVKRENRIKFRHTGGRDATEI